MEERGKMSQLGVIGGVGNGYEDRDSMDQNQEDENDSNLGTNSLDGIFSDDMDQEDHRTKKRYHRHNSQQIQELEALFKEHPHPDEKQRLELSRKLSLDPRQVKFWFQNRRTQLKTQIKRHENSILKQENDKLRSESMMIRDAMINPTCNNCAGPMMLGEVSMEEQHLRIENARLKDELVRVCALARKFLGRAITSLDSPMPPLTLPNSALELAIGNNGYAGLGMATPTLTSVPSFVPRVSSPLASMATPPPARNYATLGGADTPHERGMLLELALAAVEELTKMAQMEEPLWVPSLERGKEVLNYDEYKRMFPCITGAKPAGYVSEASRETKVVMINSQVLVETLMDAARWADMFPTLIGRGATIDTICNGMDGTRNGALQLMNAELHVLSPLVPIRSVNFLRFCKQQAENVWTVVDVSIDSVKNYSPSAGRYMSCRRLPSGCMVQNMPNGHSKVTWVEHAEYDESGVHQLYRPLLRSGLAFGAPCWVSSLHRRCECIANLITSFTTDEHSAISVNGKRSMLKLARRMTDNLCAGVCAWASHNWSMLTGANFGEDVRVMMRKTVNNSGEPTGLVLSVATSVFIPVSPRRLFDFLREERRRGEWDILCNGGGPTQEVARIAKGYHAANAVTLLRPMVVGTNESSMIILQDICMDSSVSLVVYAPVDVRAMHVVMNGGDPAAVALLPSGFAILPDGSSGWATASNGGGGEVAGPPSSGGSLLTVAFQILVNSIATAKVTEESVVTVNNLMSCTIQNIKTAVQREN